MSDQDQSGEFLRLARKIADGEQIDWSIEEDRLDGPRIRLRNLQALDSISQVHRRVVSLDLPIESWGPLEIREQIGEGGFGQVYRAYDRNLSRTVALKLLPEQQEDPLLADLRFVEEARRLAGIKHPNVVTIYGVDRFKDRSGLWMEWLEGEDLDAALEHNGPFGAKESAALGVDICHALAAVHQAELVHRDVKLSNIFRERGGRVVLMDFGSSTRRRSRTSFDDLNSLSGTPVYIAPECYEGIDSRERVDIYSLGVTLYCLSCGTYPLEPGTPQEIRKRQKNGEYVPLLDRNPELPARFIEIVNRAMHPDPQQRYQSAGELEHDLTGFLGNVQVPESSPRSKTAPKWFPALAAAAVLAVAAVAMFLIVPMLSTFQADTGIFLIDKDRGTTVELEEGSRIQPGDELFAELDLSHAAYIYILNQDSRGRQYLLFPVEGLEKSNPVPAGDGVLLPKDRRGGWVVDTAGGEDTLLVIASRAPLPFAEVLIAGLDQPGDGVPIPLHTDMATRLRGIGGLSITAPNEGDSPVDSMKSQLFLQTAEKDGVRVWEYRLRNPE
jgi:serine/threonine protein kinase